MSEEASFPLDDKQSLPEAPGAKPERSGQGLAALALLVALAAAGGAGWSAWQVHQGTLDEQQQVDRVGQLQGEIRLLGEHDKELAERLGRLPGAEALDQQRRLLVQLQGDQQALASRLESTLGASRQDWRLAEAEHLLRMASLRLTALQDINSASVLVQGADDILRQQDDPGTFAAREQLAQVLAGLRSLSEVDRTGLYLQLGALRDQVARIDTPAPVFEGEGEGLSGLSGDGAGRWERWSEALSRYVRIDLHADESVRPLLAGQNLTQVRLALTLALEQAQWAALNGRQEVYQQALVQAGEVLESAFNRNNQTRQHLLTRIAELRERPVNVDTPDLGPALAAVQAYIGRRQALREPTEQVEDGQ